MNRWTWRRIRRGALAVLALLVCATAVAALTPLVMMHLAKERATTCLSTFRGPRGPALPDCSPTIHDFEKLAGVFYTHHDATYRAEELWSRIMVGTYENAAIGNPDPRALASSSKFVDDAQTVLDKGSQRISLEELGPAIAAPHLGKLASALGDRRTLVDDYDWWGLWSVRLAAIQAALLDGRIEKAQKISKRYAEWDPRDADLRTSIGSVLCLGPDPQEGLELLTRIPNDRAEHRYAAMARNYGEVLGVMDACARRAGMSAPAPPATGSAGIADLEATRLVSEIRLEKDPKLLALSLDRAVSMLDEDAGISDEAAPFARAFLVAALVVREADADHDVDIGGAPRSRIAPDALDAMVRVHGTEDPLAPEPHDIVALAFDEGPGLHPILSPAMLAKASDELVRIADQPVEIAPAPKATKRAGAPRSADEPGPPPKENVRAGFGKDRKGAGQHGKDAEKDDKDGSAKDGGAKVDAEQGEPGKGDRPDPLGLEPASDHPHAPPSTLAERREHLRHAAGALAFHSAIAAARFGDVETAARESDRAGELLGWDARTTTLVAGATSYAAGDAVRALARLDGAPGVDARTEMEIDVVRALALASTGKRDEAREATAHALERDAKAEDPALTVEARWLDVALGPPRKIAEAPPLPLYTGQADIAHRWSTEGAPQLERDIAAWTNAIAAPAPDRLAFRYALAANGGDGPNAMVAYLVAGGRLLDEGTPGEDVEVWLDAMTAADAHRVPFGAYAFARREAARIRGDAESASRWDERLTAIRKIKGGAREMEIARFLGF